jgi:hypothetical protein
MYPDVHFLEGKLVTVGVVRVTTKDPRRHEGTLTRFNPGNAHVCGLLRHGALVGSGELDGDQTKSRGTQGLPRFGPLDRVTTYALLV